MITRWGDDALGGREADAPVQRLSRLPVGRRRRLASRIGAAHADAASLVDHLGRGEVARVLLDDLSPAGRRAARVFVEAVDYLPAAVLDGEITRRSVRDPGLFQGFEDLVAAGLVVRAKWAGGAEVVGIVPPLSRAMRPYLWLLGDEKPAGSLAVTEPAVRASAGLERLRDLALALAAAAADPPRLLRDGGVHGADLTRVHDERFGVTLEPARLERHLDRLADLGLLGGHGGRARVDWARAEAVFQLPAAARLPLLLSTDPPVTTAGAPPPGLAEAGHVRRLIAAGLLALPGGTWARREALEAAVRLRILAVDALTPYADLERAATAADQHVRAATEGMLPCLEGYRTADGEAWMRLPVSQEGDPSAGWLVQPTHEVVVPPEVPPEELVRLSRVADLVRADTVALFRVDPASVARAAASGLSVDEVLERLASLAERDLPAGLDVQVEGWLRRAAPDLYGEPPEDDGEPAPREVPSHRRPRVPRLPTPPPARWADDVARFRRAALEAAELEAAPREAATRS